MSQDFKELNQALRAGEFKALAQMLQELNPGTIADYIETLDEQRQIQVFAQIEEEEQIEVLKQLNEEMQFRVLTSRPDSFIKKIVEKMAHDERVDLLRYFTPEKRKSILAQVAAEEREDILKLSSYKEGTTGSIMTTDYAVVSKNMTIDQAIETLRAVAPDKETIYYAYVVDQARKLEGVVSLRSMLVAGNSAKISDIMTTDAVSVKADDPDNQTAQILKDNDLIAVPVTNGDNKLVGIVTFDDAMQVIEEDTTETMLQKAGISGQSDRDREREKDLINSSKLLNGPIWYPIRLRMMFLFITLAGGFLVGGVIDFYEEVLEAVIVAAVFIPVLMDMGGNVGTQSSTIFARGLALGHINTQKIFSHIRREVSIGVVMGLALGIIGGLVAYFWQGAPNNIPEIGMAVGLGLAVVVPVATLLGFLIPYILLKFGFDHAPGADPFITTIKDFVGLALYFYLVALFIGL